MKHKLILFFIFSSVVRADTSSLSFDEALHRILERSTDIHVQQTNVQAADYGVTGKKGAFLPNLSLEGQRGDSTTDGSYALPNQSLFLSSTLNLFRWGSDLNQLEGAKDDLHKEQNTLESVKLVTEELAVKVLASEIQTCMQVEVLQKNVSAYENYFSIAQQRFARGLLAKEEVDKVNVDLDNAEARLKDAESERALAKSNLARLIGLDVEVKSEWPWKARLKTIKTDRLLKISPNLDDRPDIRAAIDNVNGEMARLKAGRGTLYPALDFTVSQGASENEDGSAQQTTTMLTLNLDIFDRLSYYSQYKIQYETYAAADLKLKQLKIDAQSAWMAARDQFSIALATAVARDKSYDISQKLYNTGEIRFKRGRANANDLEVDHRRLIDSALLNVEGWSSAHQQFTKLCHTLGRSVEKCEMSL